MGCCIIKGVSEQCMARLHLTLEQKIPMFPNCDNSGVSRSLNPNPTSDEVKLNDNALHQQICTHFKVDYLEEMVIIKQTKRQIEQKINETLLALLPNKIIQTSKGPATATGMKGQLYSGSREKRAIPVMVILQAGAAVGGILIKGINALVDAKGQNHLIMHLKWSQQT